MRYLRRIIKISAWDSPNVQIGLEQERRGARATDQVVVPGVLPYSEFKRRQLLWDEMRKCVGLHGEFYLGAEAWLFPITHLIEAHRRHEALRHSRRQCRGIGIDPGEGVAKTSMCAVDEQGLIELRAMRTPNAAMVPGLLKEFIIKHGCPAPRVCIDRGGGGFWLAGQLRAMGLPVRTVSFGENVVLEPKRGKRLFTERADVFEQHYVYVNRRAQMYHETSLLVDLIFNPDGWAIPGEALGPEYAELHRQMKAIPKLLGEWSMYDREGRIQMLPKSKRVPESKEKTLVELLGSSPDELDSLVLAVYAMQHRTGKAVAGAAI